MNKRGRPSGDPRTRERLVGAARPLFQERGYQRTTVRAVAAAAGVDAALIAYHFGSKQGLFTEAMNLPRGPSDGLAAAIEGDRAGLAGRLLRAVTDLWEDAGAGGPLAAMVAAAQTEPESGRLLSEYLEHEVLQRLAAHLRGREATERAAAAVAVITGVIFTRYVVPVSSVAALTATEVHRLWTPPLHLALYPRRGREGRQPA